MNASWFKMLEAQALSGHIYHNPRFPPSPYYRFLRVLAANVKPRLSVELGLCGGGGSLHLALGWGSGTVVGVEHAKGSDWEVENWRILGETCPNFVLWKGDSVDDAGAIAAKHGKADILFIDTIHTYSRTVEEFEAWLPHLSGRAVVCFDDLHRKEMAGLWKWVPWEKVRLDALHPGGNEGGFGVAWR